MGLNRQQLEQALSFIKDPNSTVVIQVPFVQDLHTAKKMVVEIMGRPPQKIRGNNWFYDGDRVVLFEVASKETAGIGCTCPVVFVERIDDLPQTQSSDTIFAGGKQTMRKEYPILSSSDLGIPTIYCEPKDSLRASTIVSLEVIFNEDAEDFIWDDLVTKLGRELVRYLLTQQRGNEADPIRDGYIITLRRTSTSDTVRFTQKFAIEAQLWKVVID